MKTPFPQTLIPRGTSAAEVERILGLSHHLAGGVYAKMARFRAGDILVQHKHTYDHLSVLCGGRVELLVDGVRSELDATREPVVLTIAAGKHHGVKALTAGHWLCIHASDVADDDALIHPASSEPEMAEMVEALR